jgi:hypothetical protein
MADNFVIYNLQDIINFANLSEKNKRIMQNSDIIKNFIENVCPPLSYKQKILFYEQKETFNKCYYDILMDNLDDILNFEEKLDIYIPCDWSTIDTQLNLFLPLKEWSGIEFDNDYKIIKLKKNFHPLDEIVHLDLSCLHNLKIIEDNFMNEYHDLITVHIENLENLVEIGDFCLCDCIRLKRIKLSNLINLTLVGDHFLVGCNSLKYIDIKDCPENILLFFEKHRI